MREKKPRKRPEDLPLKEFAPDYIAESKFEGSWVNPFEHLSEATEAIYDVTLWERTRMWWPVYQLRKLAQEGKAEVYKRTLLLFLIDLDAGPPEGVITSFKFNRGRPLETEFVYALWLSKGKPKLTPTVCERMARQLYPKEFNASPLGSPGMKKLRDRIRATIQRFDRAATKSG
jgi:hypothetical protein